MKKKYENIGQDHCNVIHTEYLLQEVENVSQ